MTRGTRPGCSRRERARHRHAHGRQATKFNALAASGFSPRPAPRNELVIVVDGVAHSAPALQTSTSGPVLVTGHFTDREAARRATLVDAVRRGR
jgi:hypothetical protein